MSETGAVVIDFFVYIGVAVFIAWLYRDKKILGGFLGGFVLATLGAVVVTFIASYQGWFVFIVEWLITPRYGSYYLTRVNLLAAVLGAILFIEVWIEMQNRK